MNKCLLPILARIGGVLCLILMSLSCRDFGAGPLTRPITGFRIEGTVLDGLGQPLDNIPVSLFYSLEFLSSTPAPLREYTIETPGESVTVNVHDDEGAIVRNLYAGVPSGPTLSVIWDQRRNNGVLVGSGLYFVRVTVDGELRHSYAELVNGRITATTDINGIFAIPDVNLPVGFSPAPLFSGSSFTGNYRVLNWVYLEFDIAGIIYTYSVPLETDRISRLLVRAN
jgi:hypothetical protein